MKLNDFNYNSNNFFICYGSIYLKNNNYYTDLRRILKGFQFKTKEYLEDIIEKFNRII